LRNLYLSQMRRARFKGEWDDLVADRILAAPASQDKHVELGDMQRALLQLPQPQREALILVGAGGFAYEEAAEICGVAVGTIKSRVARGRVALEALMSEGNLPSRREDIAHPGRTALDSIMDEVDELSVGHSPAPEEGDDEL
jgi:RNA polymerase sigma-70 factor (ECF subfamily)